MLADFFIWIITLASLGCVLWRPWGLSEAVWACGGAALLVVTGLLAFRPAFTAILAGADVYLFLAGMMALSELARDQGVFDWLAALATESAGGSTARLFTLIYGVGILITALLSNDATAVVLTPAVLVAVRRAQVEPKAHLLACAFIANAASFLLPISNPANLIIYPHQMPPLLLWLRLFLLPSLAAIGLTYLGLLWVLRAEVQGRYLQDQNHPVLSAGGRTTLIGLFFAVIILVTASALQWKLGAPTALVAAGVILLLTLQEKRLPLHIVQQVSWSVLPLVAGLFVLVAGLQKVGLLSLAQEGLRELAAWPHPFGALGAAFAVGLLSNVMNNLPIGLIGGVAAQGQPLASAVLIGVDLGPNLSVTGSLATILWLIVLRREGMTVSAGDFFRVGLIVMPVALLGSILLLF